MSGGTRIPLTEAWPIAERLADVLGRDAEQVGVAGSIRRGRPTVGDIELVLIPMTDERLQYDLFGALVAQPPLNLLDIGLDTLLEQGTLQMREPKRWGERYKAALFEGVPIDLFSVVPPAQFGVIYLIRTGSADFTRRFVTPVEKGGWMPAGMYCREGQLWKDGEPLHTPTEESVFEAVGRAWIPPSKREVTP